MMWTTEILAIDPADGQLRLWQGPHVSGSSLEEATEYCQQNGLGYCKVAGKFVEEIGWNTALFATRLEQNKN